MQPRRQGDAAESRTVGGAIAVAFVSLHTSANIERPQGGWTFKSLTH